VPSARFRSRCWRSRSSSSCCSCADGGNPAARESRGAGILAVATTLGVLGVAAALFSVYRTVAVDGNPGVGSWGHTAAITAALASGVVGALAVLIATRFGRRDPRVEAVRSAIRKPSTARLRAVSALLGAAAVGDAVFVVCVMTANHPGARFGDVVSETSLALLYLIGLAFAAVLVDTLVRQESEAPPMLTGVMSVLAGATAFLDAYVFVFAMWTYDRRGALGVQLPTFRHEIAAVAAAGVCLAFGALHVAWTSSQLNPDPDQRDDGDEISVAELQPS
jgi:hypothetical protein